MASLPVIRHYRITRGQSWLASFRFLAGGSPLGLTGWSFACQARSGRGRSATLLSDATVTIDDSERRVNISFSADQTGSWPAGRVYADLWAVDSLDRRWPYISFILDVAPGQTVFD